MKNKEHSKIRRLFVKLCESKLHPFPSKGYTEDVGVSSKQGVYVVYNSSEEVVHVGRTQRGKNGLRQRLNNHLLGQSSFVEKYLRGSWKKLRSGYKFRYLVEKDARKRALLEAFSVGKLCPLHLGLGQ